MHHHWKRLSFLLAAVAVAAVPFACGGDDTGMDPDPGPVDTITVTLTGDPPTFMPAQQPISAGDVIEWVDEADGVEHTVTPDGHSEWSSQSLADGEVFRHKFEEAGTYPYLCIPHEGAGMTGTITVE